jgi:cytohesin
VIRALLDKGADIDARDNTQWTPLHVAAGFNPGQVKILIESGANVNVLSSGQESPLYKAAFIYNNKREAVIELCKAGANPQLGKHPLDSVLVSKEMKQLIREKCLSL